MSIIHDALKKVQTNTPAGSNFSENIQRPDPTHNTILPNISTDGAKRSLTVFMAAVLSIAVIVIFAILYQFAFATTEHSKKKLLTTDMTEAVPKPHVIAPKIIPQILVKPVPSVQQIPSAIIDHPLPVVQQPLPAATYDDIHIEGVMSMGGKMVALVNGGVYEEGQTVNNKIIAKITFENITVFMLENGEKKILAIRPANR